MKIYGTKPNRKNGIYSSGRRGKKEEEDAVGTLWLRLGEDSTRENLTVGVGEVEEGETGRLSSLLALLFHQMQKKGPQKKWDAGGGGSSTGLQPKMQLHTTARRRSELQH